MRRRLFGPALALLLASAAPASAQGTTQGPASAPAQAPADAVPRIADLRADLAGLAADLQGLRAMLQVSGAAGYASLGGTDAIARMDGIEAELRRLTAATEEARNRVELLSADMATRLDELEFRLCQLDEQCDLGALMSGDGMAGGLTGGPGGGVNILLGPEGAGGADLPVSAAERSDFDAAQALAQAGNHRAAAQAFGAVAEDHAGGPLFAEARFREGQELLALGDARAASRAWTDVFAADPGGPRAPEALLGVARITADTGQTGPACLFLSEVALRYGAQPQAAEAAELQARLGCAGLLADPDDGAGD